MKINFNGNPSILKNFLYYLISTKGYSIHTIKNYQLDLMLFLQSLLILEVGLSNRALSV